MTEPTRERIVAGCMTGTSLDGLDAALVRIVGTGLDMSAQYLGHVSLDMPQALRQTLMHLASGGAAEPLVYMRAARALGELHADAVEQLLAGGLAPPRDGRGIDFVTAHGQTIWHAPCPRKEDEGQSNLGPMSWQLFDPWPVVKRIGVPVCYDLRQADLIAGGEGAPLTPLADWVMYRDKAEVILNLGGICNATWLREADPTKIHGFDVCPCNLLLNGLTEKLFSEPYDRDGLHASGGKPSNRIKAAVDRLFKSVAADQRSQGRETFPPGWESGVIQADPQAGREDVLASVVSSLGESLAMFVLGIDEPGLTIVLAGGGARNLTLLACIQQEMAAMGTVTLSDDLGIPCEAREAMGFAVLGALSQDGVPVSLPQVTGAKDPGVAGVWAGVNGKR